MNRIEARQTEAILLQQKDTMGNLEFKAAFKPAEQYQNLGYSTEVLLKNAMISVAYLLIEQHATKENPNLQKLFSVSNVQKNNFENQDEAKQHFAQALLAHLNENYTSGFATPETNLNMLKDCAFDKYFSVQTDAATQDYTQSQRKKFLVIYNLFNQVHESSKVEKSFFAFVEELLSKDCDRTTLGLDVGLRLTLALLNELQTLSPKFVGNSLHLIYQAMCDMPLGSLYAKDKTSFVSDATLNDTRAFLCSLIETWAKNWESNFKSLELCFQILVRLGMIRSNPEDFLVAINMLNKHEFGKLVDFRAEVRAIPTVVVEDAQLKETDKELAKTLFEVRKGVLQDRMFSKSDDSPLSQDVENSDALCSDGKFLYLYKSGLGLFKLSCERDPHLMSGIICDNNSDIAWEAGSRMLFFQGKLFVRNPGNKDKPFEIIDASLLKKDDKATEAIKLSPEDGAITLGFTEKPHKVTGRHLEKSPFFTDGKFFYVVSLTKPTEKSNEDEEEQVTKIVVECFDPSTPDYAFVRSTPLYKNEQLEPYIKGENKIDAVNNFVFAANGQYIFLCTEKKFNIFDAITGVRLFKKQVPINTVNSTLKLLTHDYINNFFYQIVHNGSNFFEEFSIPQFKASVPLAGEVRSSVQSPLETFKIAYLGEKPAPKPSLNVLERIIKNQSNEVPKVQETLPTDSVQLMSAILLGYTKLQCDKFTASLEQAKAKNTPKEQTYIQFFKFPGATYLTSLFFNNVRQLLLHFSNELTQAPKTKKNLAKQYSFKFLLDLLSVNFSALGQCGIQISEILEEDEYKQFLNTYETTIMKMIRDGYSTECAESDSDKAEILTLWKTIYASCQAIMSNSLQMIYANNIDIIKVLQTNLPKIHSEKEAEHSSFSLHFLARQHNCKRLLSLISKEEDRNAFTFVFDQCVTILKKSNATRISSYAYATESATLAPEFDLLVQGANEFVRSIGQEVLIQFSSQFQLVAGHKQGKKKTGQAKLKQEEQASKLKDLENLVANVFASICDLFGSQVACATTALIDPIRNKDKDFFKEEAAQLYRDFSSRMDQIITPTSCTLSLYVNVLAQVCDSYNLICLTSKAAIGLLGKISAFLKEVRVTYKRHLLGKANDEQDSDAADEEISKDKFSESLDGICSSLTWLVGNQAFSLITVKKETEDAAQKVVTPDKQMEKLLMDSKLLSGGIQNRFLYTFKEDVKRDLNSILEITSDFTLHELLEVQVAENDDDKLLNNVFTGGQSPFVDEMINVLQSTIMRIPKVAGQARIAGEDGMRMSRVAFAVMLKFSQQAVKFERMVDEVDCLDDELQGVDANTRLQKMRESLKEHSEFDDLVNLWTSASRMRLWITEKKKNLSEKLEREMTKEYKDEKSELKKKHQQKEEEAKTDAPKTEEAPQVIVIDTKTKKDSEEKSAEKPADEKATEESKEEATEEVVLTDEDKTKIQTLVDEKFQKALNEIYDKISEKAQWLLRMSVPTAYTHLKTDDTAREGDDEQGLYMIRYPSYLPKSMPATQTEETQEDQVESQKKWSNRLKQWKAMMHSKGTIKSFTELRTEIFESTNMSVLAFLQTPITAHKIQKRVEKLFLNGTKRTAGLHLLASLSEMYLPAKNKSNIVNWFCAGLRDRTNKLSHYLSEVKGCGNYLENRLCQNFFKIYAQILDQLKETKDKIEACYLLDALKWKFLGRDHTQLLRLNVFTVLHSGNGHRKNILKRAWGRPVNQELNVLWEKGDGDKRILTKEVLATFEQLFLTVISRIIDSDLGQAMNVKSKGTAIPTLERSKSVIDSNASESLIAQAFEILFKEFNRYVKVLDICKGVDWSTYVTQKNREKKDGSDALAFPDELLFDEDLVEKAHAKAKEELRKQKEEADAKKEAEKAETPSESVSTPATEETSTVLPLESEEKTAEEKPAEEKPAEEEKNADVKSDKDKTEEDEVDAKTKADEAEKQKLEEAQTACKDKLKKMAEDEIKIIYKVYAETFVHRLIRLVELFTSVSIKAMHPLNMVQRVANPFMLFTLLNLTLSSSPTIQLVAIKIVANLVTIGIPAEVFEASTKMMADVKDSKADLIVNQTQTKIKFESPFLTFFFNYLLTVRSAMWSKTEIQSEGSYEVSQEISKLFLAILKDTTHHDKEWNKRIFDTMKQAFLNLDQLSQAEIESLFSLSIGADFTRISVGSFAITSQNQIVTVLGFTESALTGELSAEDLKKHSLSKMPLTDKAKLVGLFYDQDLKGLQEVLAVPCFDVRPLVDLDESKLKEVAMNSAFMDPEVIKLMFQVLTASTQGKDSVERMFAQNIQVQILKAVQALFKILSKDFLDFLTANNLLESLITYLQANSSGKASGSKSVVPLTWLETKCTNIKTRAIETSQKLDPDTALIAQIVEGNQLLFTQTDKNTNDQLAFNKFLQSGINMHRVNEKSEFQVHLNPASVSHRLPKSKLKNGLVFVEQKSMAELNEEALEILQSSNAVATYGVKARDLFIKMVDAAKTSSEESTVEKPVKDWAAILNCAVFILSKQSFDDVVKRGSTADALVKPEEKMDFSKMNAVEQILSQLKQWGGIDTQKVLYHFSLLEEKTSNSLNANLKDILEKIETEEKEWKEKIAEFERNEDSVGLIAEKTKQGVQKTVREKAIVDFQQQILKSEEVMSTVDKIVAQVVKDNSQPSTEVRIFSMLSFKPDEVAKLVDKAIDGEIKDHVENASNEDVTKTQEAMAKQFFREISVPERGLTQLFSETLQDLQTIYSKVTLLNIMATGDLAVLVPILLQTPESQKRLSCFLKSSFNQAVLTRTSTGQKSDLKIVKENLRRFFAFCVSEGGALGGNFFMRFLTDDVIEAGNLLLENSKEAHLTFSKHFSIEENALTQLSPYLLKFVVSVMLQTKPNWFNQSKTCLPALFNLCVQNIVKFWNKTRTLLVEKMLHCCIQMIYYSSEQAATFAANGVLEKVINNEMLTRIVQKMDFRNDDADNKKTFTEVKRLILEAYVALINLYADEHKKGTIKFDKILQITKGISDAKRGYLIVKEKEQFKFLKYLHHHDQLKDFEKKLMIRSFETQHPCFDVTTRAKFSIGQVERMKIKISEKIEFKPLTFFGIGSKPDGSDMEVFSKADFEKDKFEKEFNRSHFYTFYPVKKQMVVSFGESRRGRTGLATASDTPQLVMQTKDFVPTSVHCSKNHSLLMNEKGEFLHTGERAGCDDATEFKTIKVPSDKKEFVVKKLSVGPQARWVLSQDNKVYYAGKSKQFALPEDSATNNWKVLKLSSDEAFKDKVVDIAVGNWYTLFVTEGGKLWALGNRLLKKLGLESEVPIQLPVSEDLFVTRAWASSSRDMQLALIECRNKEGKMHLYSAGKNDQGLLGQGQRLKEKKQFGPLDYDSKAVQFQQVSVFADHAMAIDQNGELWAWGSNLQYRAGFAQEINEGVYAPTKVPFLAEKGLKAIKVSAGFDHSLLLAEDQNKKQRMFSIGKEETNFKHLGTTLQTASEAVVREISYFSDFKVVDFAASSKFSMVIVGGDRSPEEGLYKHELPNGQTASGLVHFFKQNNQWTYLSEAQYDLAVQSKSLPDICFAIKCPITNWEAAQKALPDLSQLGIFGDCQTPAKSSVSGEALSGVRYCSSSKVNNDEMCVVLSEQELRAQSTEFDLHPLVYYRLTKPVKDGERLPSIDLKKIFPVSTKFGFKCEVIPDTSYIINDNLVDLTKAGYTEILETCEKFPIECDKELLAQMNKQLIALNKAKLTDVDPKKDFNVSEMVFKNELMKKVPESVKKLRIQLVWKFNLSFIQIFPYLPVKPVKPFRGQASQNQTASELYNAVKKMILTSVKMKFVDECIQKLPNGSETSISVKRNAAIRFEESGKVDHTAEFSVFGQIMQQLKKKSDTYENFRQSNIDQKAYDITFKGEASIDAGGPYRESLTNLVAEMEKPLLPLFVKTSNNRNDHGENRECFVVNSTSKTPTHSEMFKFVGVLIGYAFRSKSCMPYNLAPVFWKQLVGEELNFDDLKSFDTYSWQMLQDLRTNASKYSAQEFDAIVDQKFTAVLNSGKEVQLCPEGATKQVTKENVEDFISLFLKKRSEEGADQMRWIQEGVFLIVSKVILNMLDWEEVECRAAGDKVVDIDKLKSITTYNCDENSVHIKRFWTVLSAMSEELKQAYLKFVWGRQRLPVDVSNLRRKHEVRLFDHWSDNELPQAHTCFFMLDWPAYTTDEIAEKRLTIAITFCGEIDGDGGINSDDE